MKKDSPENFCDKLVIGLKELVKNEDACRLFLIEAAFLGCYAGNKIKGGSR